MDKELEELKYTIEDWIDDRRFEPDYPILSYKDTQKIVEYLLPNIQALITKEKNKPVTIMGKTIDEVCVILSALELERITDIKVTMENLDKLAKKMQEDIWEANQKAINHAVNSYVDFGSIKRRIE